MTEDHITLTELMPEDMKGFLAWGHHTDLRFLHYDFPDIPETQLLEWYSAKKIPFFRWLYVAKDQHGALLGYMTVKHINPLLRKAELGIVFDPGRLGQGYGTQGMIAFLRIYFFKRNMREIRLRVAQFNQRAQRAYEKVGFQQYASRLEAFEEQGRNFELVLNYPDQFTMDGAVLMTSFNLMRLTRDQFTALHGK